MIPRRVRALLLALATASACASCASALLQTAPGSTLPTTTSPGTPPSNRAATTRETERLLGLARIPNSKRSITTAPKALAGPVAGTPQSKSLIDSVRVWRVPMSFGQAVTWLQNHPPTRLPPAGSSSSSDQGTTTSTGYSYDDHASVAWQEAELEIGIAPDGAQHTYWRADGVALWLDPRPLNVPTGGTRLTVTASCPASDQGTLDVPPSGITTSLVPSDTATGGLICRYDGLNGRFALTSQSRLSAAQASRIAGLAQRVQLSHTNGDVVSCPMDDGSAIAVNLVFAGRSDVELFDSTTGCASVSNGTIRAPSFARGLAALTHALS